MKFYGCRASRKNGLFGAKFAGILVVTGEETGGTTVGNWQLNNHGKTNRSSRCHGSRYDCKDCHVTQLQATNSAVVATTFAATE